MKILVTGSSGLIGSAVCRRLLEQGQTVICLVRRKPSAGEVEWNPDAGMIDAGGIAGVDAVVHLAGESIAAKRWSEAQKARILSSRINGTQLIAKTVADLRVKPHVMVSASAVGFYGNRGDELICEDTGAGSGFLADVCQKWERATAPAEAAGIRVVHLRLGVVLARSGGALSKMLPPFRMGLGGDIGNGRQWMSWVSLEDVVGIVNFAIENESLAGAVNAVAPQPVTNHGFTRALGRVIRRPVVAPMPEFAARIVFGEMADELLLAGAKADPARLRAAGFAFKHPDIDSALRACV